MAGTPTGNRPGADEPVSWAARELSMALTTQAPMLLPAPTGPRPVGTSIFHVGDASRGMGPDADERPRILTVHAWYPAAGRGGAPAPYLREPDAARAFREANPGLAERLLLEGVATHAALDAPVARVQGGLPVLVFSHGYLAMPGDYTALMEDLASHGYAVFSIVHPYETTATALGEGRVATMLGEQGLNPLAADVLAEWGDEDSVAAAATSAPDRASAEAILREYLGRIPKSTGAIERWTEDTRVVVDRLHVLAALGSGDPFAGRLALARLGALGHSMGGITSAAFCARDRRCRAAINLDGLPQYGDLIDRPGTRPFLMVYAARPGRVGASDAIYAKGDSAWRADIADALHLNFGDFQYRTGAARLGNALGEITAERSTAIVHRLVLEWFGHWLLGRRSVLLGGESLFPELRVTPIARE